MFGPWNILSSHLPLLVLSDILNARLKTHNFLRQYSLQGRRLLGVEVILVSKHLRSVDVFLLGMVIFFLNVLQSLAT